MLSPRPGRVAAEHRVNLPRPRTFEVMASREVFDLTNEIKGAIVGKRVPRGAVAMA